MVNRKGKRADISLFLILVIMILGLAPPSVATDEELITLTGLVIDFETRQPINNATVKVWMENSLVARNYTNALGLFTLQVPGGRDYRVYAYADDPRTPGWDYLPALEEVPSPTGGVNLTVGLRPGASVIIDNDIQFVDSTTSVKTYTYEVRAPGGETLDIEGYRPVYGTAEEVQSRFLDLNASYLVVPAGVLFDVRVNASVIIGGRMVTRSFIIDEPGHLNLSKGDLVHLDVRKYSLQYNVGLMEERIREVEVKMDEMERLGFYLFLERRDFTTVSGLFDSAKFNLLRGAYRDSFTDLRWAYEDTKDLYNRLVGMFRSAATSVYILIFFLAFTSTAIAFLMLEKPLHKVAASVGLTALIHIVLHEIYPGANYIPTLTFFGFSAVAWCVAVFTTIVVPHFMKGRGFRGKTPLRNIIVPIFSLAKRSLTRRRLRFVLTLSSVMVLVLSFVTLTSFTMGYGLIHKRVSDQPTPIDGVIMKSQKTEFRSGGYMFIPLEETTIEWFQKQGEVELVAPKAENQPSLMPILWLKGNPIYGVIGIRPSAEAQILGLDEIIVEGRYLRDGEEDAILISDDLREELGIEVNATLRLGEKSVRVVGIYGDEELKKLKDLDGSSIIPNKLVNLRPPEEEPSYDVVPAETKETIISNLEPAREIPGVYISRIDAVLGEGESVNDFAVRAALERNYNVLASSSEGLYVARLGTQFQGKGLPLAVPWGIVVLNVVITMLNSLYERRGEVHILSSVGLNPAHIAGVFVAEAVAIGLIGGGMGYLLGLGLYRVMALVGITLEVRQKVSALWSFGALAISMVTVVIGAVSAIKGSVIITPSLMRRWRMEERKEIGEPLEIVLPISVPSDEIDDFLDYIVRVLKSYEDDPFARTERIRVWREDTEEKSTRGIRFIYRTVGGAFASFSTNRLIAESEKGEEVYTVRMHSVGDNKWVYETGSLVRMIIMRWSTRK